MRVEAFLAAGNDHRETALGGRRKNSSVWADLNTDNSLGESSLRVAAKVMGSADDRKSHFTITLPTASAAVTVSIHGDFPEIQLPGGFTLKEATEAVRLMRSLPQNNRKQVADRCLAEYNFGDDTVKVAGNWDQTGDEWTCLLSMTGPADDYRCGFIVRFFQNSDEILECYPGDRH